ncbi:hypothetical protein [Herbidospora mongoliensis]|uniref:hypothetical protein n=1 Tax=Herbidospora mongoliensis TaxID=688067 RepID=UPI0008316D20|nr:hypothetical protein [Herbidospora mongoliensis]
MNAQRHHPFDVSVVVAAADSVQLDRWLTHALALRASKEILVADSRLARLYASLHRHVHITKNPLNAPTRGRYTYFAGDHLSPVDLMIETADRSEADLVATAPQACDDASLTDIYDDLSLGKLFRTAFRDRFAFTDAADFVVHAYCHAERIATVRGRQEMGRHHPDRLVRRVQSHLPSGDLRDQLIARHITRDVLPDLAEPFLEADDTARHAIVRSVAHRCAAWVTPGVRAQLDATDQVRLASLQDHRRLERLARISEAPLHRALRNLEWEGDRLRIEFTAALEGFPEAEIGLVLRDGDPQDVWDVYVTAECDGIVRQARLEGGRDIALPVRFTDDLVALPYLTRTGTLSLRKERRLIHTSP